MEIVGGLIQLGPNRFLPLPWHVRAYLGLQLGARAYLMITRPSAIHQPPDIIVSPANLRTYGHSRALTVDHPEAAGSFADLLRELARFKKLNIAIADTVTVETRDRHRVNLVIEPSRPLEPEEEQELDRNYENLEAILKNKYGPDKVKLARFQKFENSITAAPYNVSGGFIKDKQWHDRVTRHCADLGITEFDLERVVVSGNTEGRYIRYIFPRKGAFTVSIPHSDAPGMLHALASATAECGLNILSSRLSRTPPASRPEISQYVAVVEPSTPGGARLEGEGNRELKEKLRVSLAQKDDADPHHDILSPHFDEGRSAEQVRYLPPPQSRTIFMPAIFAEAAADALKSPGIATAQQNRPKIFLCYRFFGDDRSPNKRIILEIKRILRKNNIDYLEADPDVRVDRTYDYIHSRLWLSSGCLVLAFSRDLVTGEYTGGLSINQTHEIGFMQGQDKPFKIIVSNARRTQAQFPNVPDHSFLTYEDDATAVDASHQDYIGAQIGQWVTQHFSGAIT